jgi:hypothetical protein
MTKEAENRKKKDEALDDFVFRFHTLLDPDSLQFASPSWLRRTLSPTLDPRPW